MAIGLLCAVLGGASGAQAQAPVPAVQPDPSVRYGQLPNGLRFAVAKHGVQPGALSLRLLVGVGSYDEADDERGVAHFVEHMAFNGTRRFGEDQLESVFAPLGVGFGRDHNAFTSQVGTSFHLDLPSADVARLTPAFQWLRDVADGMVFDPAAVNRERGVILAEREARLEADDAWREPLADFRYRGLRSQTRQPIGAVETVRAADASRLRAFYDRWYRPENAMVIAVGDLPAERLEALVREAFGDWRGRGAAGVRAPRQGSLDVRGPEYLFDVHSHAPFAASACRVQPPRPGRGTPAALRDELAQALWMTVLDARLAARQGRDVLSALTTGETRPDARVVCVEVSPSAGRMGEAIAAVTAELTRFQQEGPTEAEMEAAVGQLRASHRGAVTQEATLRPEERADALMGQLLDGPPGPSAREAMRVFNLMAEELTTADLHAAFKADWAGSGPLLAVTSKEAVDEALVRAAWEGRHGPVTAAKGGATGQRTTVWPYERFGRDGHVVRREEVGEPGFVRLAFSNGVTVNFKQTRSQAGQVLVRVKFGAGRREIPDRDFQLALFGAAYLKQGGLGRISYDDLAALTRAMEWDVDLKVRDRAFELDGKTFATGLEAQLSFLAAYLTDPGFQPVLNGLAPVLTDQTIRNVRADPGQVTFMGLDEAIAPGAPINLPPPEVLLAARNTDFARVLKPVLTGAPLQVTIVGDVKEAAVVDAMSRTLAAIPARRDGSRQRADTWYRRFPAAAPGPIRLTHQGAADKAMVSLFWPLFVGAPDRRREEYALRLVGAVYEDALRHAVRERLGMTYAPAAGAAVWDHGDQGYFWVSVETSPRDLERVEAEVRALGARLARGEITQTELEASRTPLLAGWRRLQDDNDWWLDVLSAADQPEEMHALLKARDTVASLTLEEVRAAATRWLAPPPIPVLAQPAQTKEPKT